MFLKELVSSNVWNTVFLIKLLLCYQMHFDYGCTVWSNFSSELQSKVQVLHNNLARIILSADIRTPVNDMMNALQWVKLEKRWHEQLFINCFQMLKNMGLSYLSSQLEFVHDYHSYKTRNHTPILQLYQNLIQMQVCVLSMSRQRMPGTYLSPIVRTESDSITTSQFKGVLHLLPKIIMFCVLSQINQQLFVK